MTVNSKNSEDEEILTKLANANKCLGACKKLIASKLLSNKTKIRLYKTIIQPVLLYGSETWVMSKRNEKRLIVFENKILRKIFGPVQEGEIWRIRKNQELRVLYTDPDIVAIVKARRLSWIGHVLRRQNGNRLLEVWRATPVGKRPLGRPKLRWTDQVKKDIGTMGADINLAEDRAEWKRLVYEAKNQLRFVEPRQ